ncbi:hypothetical protein HYH03_004012 [Edaphochlamys debaryana]|uniref:Elongator complex protein 4 n=1 Tax=Edaphochlamys debaryana TaxID=47281 RepID=A0A835YBL4_9CHLO|nr:hypothetical protein HYH03_004012 [Edaphochlamys debaryana]|eukprot:KAG2498263.1 hypothetical protein HYH03_004012 [Edaphochlamys debaryana]
MGTRPGLHGQTLISMGLVDLDRLLSGGLPLGSVLLLLEDPCSGQHLNFLRYFMAEGVSCRQRVMWLTASPPVGGPGTFLPAEASVSEASASGADKPGEETELRIAWQYKKYIKDEPVPTASSSSSRSQGGASASRPGAAVAAGVGRQWCRSYDLTRPLGAEGLQGAQLDVVECSGPSAYAAADDASATFLASFAPAPEPPAASSTTSTTTAPAAAPAPAVAPSLLRRGAEGPGGVGRLVVESAGSLGWGGGGAAAEQALLSLLFNLRRRALGGRCAVLVTVPAGLLSPGSASRACLLADTLLALDPLGDDSPLARLLPDPQTASALLSVRRLCGSGMLGPRQPDGQLWVVRNKRKRLGLSPVEVDPDAEERAAEAAARAVEVYSAGAGKGAGGAAGSGSGTGAGAGTGRGKSAAAMLCGGPPGGGNKALDF